jgi:hypothetical protein
MESTIRIHEALHRVKGVFLEVPGTVLSLDQASRLAGLERDVCESVLLALEDARFLKRARDGRFCLETSDPEA